jgi:hypothetical protein
MCTRKPRNRHAAKAHTLGEQSVARVWYDVRVFHNLGIGTAKDHRTALR